jgi:hypothetical protein
MKKLLIALFILASLYLQAQTITQQIDSAKAFSEMPILKLTTAREFKNAYYNSTSAIAAGETVMLYFPVYIYDSGNITRAEEKYNYLSTSPELNKTDCIHRNLVLYLSNTDRQLLIKWLNKYEYLGKQQMKLEQPTSPY